MTELITRQEVPVEKTWRLEDIFATDKAWDEEFAAVSALVEDATKFSGHLGESSATVLQALQSRDEIYERAMKLYTYAHMRYDQDTTNSFYQGMNGRIQSLAATLSSALSYITPELLALDEATLEGFVKENEALGLYKQHLAELALERPHTLPKEQEALLAQLAEVTGASAQTFGMLNNADLVFPLVTDPDGNEVRLTHGNYIKMLESSKREVREGAFKAMYETYGNFKNTFASTLIGQVKRDNVNARIRNYDSARHAAMAANFIPENVYDQLIETINKNLPLLHPRRLSAL